MPFRRNSTISSERSKMITRKDLNEWCESYIPFIDTSACTEKERTEKMPMRRKGTAQLLHAKSESGRRVIDLFQGQKLRSATIKYGMEEKNEKVVTAGAETRRVTNKNALPTELFFFSPVQSDFTFPCIFPVTRSQRFRRPASSSANDKTLSARPLAESDAGRSNELGGEGKRPLAANE